VVTHITRAGGGYHWPIPACGLKSASHDRRTGDAEKVTCQACLDVMAEEVEQVEQVLVSNHVDKLAANFNVIRRPGETDQALRARTLDVMRGV